LKLAGKTWKYGDNVDTDSIIPGRYCHLTAHDELAKHALEDLDKSFASSVKMGDIIVAGENFGCGSSRELAPITLKAAGVSCIIAKSFARIFYRNAINMGFPIFESPKAVEGISGGELVSIDLNSGTILNESTGKSYTTIPFPNFVRQIIDAGGLINYTKNKLGEKDEKL
jgi:3-isopropylmalate/(R)-2-methylmalate dehydratase small subunit